MRSCDMNVFGDLATPIGKFASVNNRGHIA